MDSSKYQLTLFDWREGTGDHHVLEARVEEDGSLVLDGYDCGESVRALLGDFDYEYSRTVAAEQVPWVLLHLIKERFAKESDFAEWLKEKQIPSDFRSWT